MNGPFGGDEREGTFGGSMMIKRNTLGRWILAGVLCVSAGSYASENSGAETMDRSSRVSGQTDFLNRYAAKITKWQSQIDRRNAEVGPADEFGNQQASADLVKAQKELDVLKQDVIALQNLDKPGSTEAKPIKERIEARATELEATLKSTEPLEKVAE
jgi:hypothetical protein